MVQLTNSRITVYEVTVSAVMLMFETYRSAGIRVVSQWHGATSRQRHYYSGCISGVVRWPSGRRPKRSSDA